MNLPKEFDSRVGFFKISDVFIRTKPYAVLKIFSKIIIVRAEHLVAEQSFHYSGYSKLFKPVAYGERIPEYSIYYSEVTKTLTVEKVI